MAHLLGHIIDHRDRDELSGPPRYTMAMQLLNTINSLLRVLENDIRSNGVSFGVAFAIAISAKMTLLNMYACPDTNRRVNCVEETEMQALALQEFQVMVTDIVHLGQLLRLNEQVQLNKLSPLVCDSFYQAAATAIWYHKENGSEQMRNSYDILLANLQSMHTRWKIAGSCSGLKIRTLLTIANCSKESM